MLDENISVFRQELERVKSQFEEKFQDIMISVRADRENDKQTLELATQNANNDKKSIEQNRALSDKLETMLNVQNLMLTQLRDMNEKVKDLSDQAGGGAGGLGMLAGLGLAGAGGFAASEFLNRTEENTGNTSPGPTNTVNGGGSRPSETPTGDVANEIRSGLMERLSSNMGLDQEKAAMITEAFVVNFQSESGLDPNIVERVPNVHGTRGKGLYQLTGSRREEYERIYGDDYSIDNQLDFLINELSTSEASAWEKISSADNVGDAAASIVRNFLRPAAQHREERETQYRQDTRTGSQVLEEYERERQRLESENNPEAERVRGEPIPLDQIVTGGLKTNVANEETGRGNLYHTRYPSRGTPHNETYEDYSMGTRPFWEELPEGLTEGQNTRTLTDPETGESFESTFYVIPHPSGQGFTTTQMLSNDRTGLRLRNSLQESRSLADQLGGRTPTFEEEEQLAESADVTLDLFGKGFGPDGAALANIEEIVNSQNIEARIAPAYMTPEENISGGGGEAALDGGINEDMLVDTPQPEFDLSDPFPLVAPLRAANTLITAGLPTPQEPETEQPETPRMGGGTGTPSPQEPQIEANAIGRFPWAEKLIRYYNLSNMVKTNMLT